MLDICSKKPKNFLEIGVFHGVTARNVCELLHKIHGNDFKYVGLDLFGESPRMPMKLFQTLNLIIQEKKYILNIF